MLKSLYSGVSGMKGFQTKLDVIGNNIANVNTIGFKKGRVVFQDIVSQNLSGAVAPIGQQSGVNPKQVGLGVKVGSIDNIHTPGSPMTTNVGTDLAIDGDAFFVVTHDYDGSGALLTRAGNFNLDANGNLVNGNGYFVSGTAVENPPVGSPAGTLGTTHLFPINLTKDETSNLDANGQVINDVNGNPTSPLKFTSYSIDSNGYFNVVREDGKTGKLAMVMDPASPNYGRYYLNLSSTTNQNENISVATAVVSNPGGLSKVGNTMFEETGNSGVSQYGRIADTKGGLINTGSLEMSNVDLTEEFTEMIIAQRGFQANARTITTSDSVLEELINLKR